MIQSSSRSQSVPVPSPKMLVGEGSFRREVEPGMWDMRLGSSRRIWLPEFNPRALMGPWLECGKGICFASRQIVGSTPIGSTIANGVLQLSPSFPQDFSFLPGFQRAVRFAGVLGRVPLCGS